MNTTPHTDLRAVWNEATRRARPGEQVAVILTCWTTDRSLEDASRRRLGDLLRRFARRLQATGITSLLAATPADCEAFIWAPGRTGTAPALATAHLRRTTLRTAYRTITTLTGHDVDPTRHIALPPRSRRGFRPVTDEELQLLRAAALARTRGRDRTLATLALAEATATSSETPRVTWRDIDLPTGTVVLAGAHPVRARTGHLSLWGLAVLRRIADAPKVPDDSVTYLGTAGGASHAGQAQTSGRLRALLDEAGLTDPDLVPGSIRLWRPARALTDGAHIEDVARMLGLTSLDTTAQVLGHQWQDA